MLKLAVVVVVLFLIGVLAAAAISPGNSEVEDGGPLTMEELSLRVAEIWQSDLRDVQRRRELGGRITVVSVDCVEEKKPLHFTCLAHAAGTGEARQLAEEPRTITGRLGRGGGYSLRYRD